MPGTQDRHIARDLTREPWMGEQNDERCVRYVPLESRERCSTESGASLPRPRLRIDEYDSADAGATPRD